GTVELFVLGVGMFSLPLAALVWARRRRPQVDATRRLHPPRAHAGTEARVDLQITNTASRPSPVLGVAEPFGDGRQRARFLLAPMAPGESSRAAFRLPTDRRGVFDLGPLEVAATDPFGMASAVAHPAARTQLTVYPRIDPLSPPPLAAGGDPHAGTEHATAQTAGGEDFFALRPYQVGDDLRRVHWPTTARLDDIVIRQEEMPWQARTTVLLDIRRSAHDDASLERAVSAAASILAASWRRRALLRLVSTDGADSGFSAGAAHVEGILEHLATVGLAGGDQLAAVTARLRQAGNGGALVALTTTRAGAADLAVLSRLQVCYPDLAVVAFARARGPAAAGPMARLLVVGAGEPFAPLWERHVR
ncbi:MAG: DUF58 domain-containing protein, partial [Acidimicrobiales bacterium]